ncbi:MAG: response regulator [Oscillatoriaceae bacterium SKW80]|nr:response regulator [Oscillatoriaceae bacterium SKYG93]MCX8121423.1 response regulator [Oscillatoriaceae bacterium SKW80]MDW8451900.1 response regulator [Oscillatoriaceae cyanobacterium SKYGB_i_bin93]HIK29443.1 response regulator [Oscillatoriaceae cyanobacterium M7585_C2015_266]
MEEFKPEELEAIAAQTRVLFLQEEAPEYLAILEQGIEKLQENSTNLIRAAHSLKGGAGMAQMSELSQLAHKLEDLLLALQNGHVSKYEAAVNLVRRCVEKIRESIEFANNEIEIYDWSIIGEIDAFLQEDKTKEVGDGESQDDLTVSDFVKKALLYDLEDCITRLEAQFDNQINGASLQEALASFVEECTLLGQVLSLPWLIEAVDKLRSSQQQNGRSLKAVAVETISNLRALRASYLGESKSKQISEEPAFPIVKDLFEIFSFQPKEEEGEIKEISSPPIPERFLKYIVCSTDTDVKPALNVRVPVAQLELINNTIGELLINCERLFLYQRHLVNVIRNLKICHQKFENIRQQFQFICNNKKNSMLLRFQELMVIFNESRADVKMIADELEESIEFLRSQVECIHADLRASRLVPFGLISERFEASLLSLTQQYGKSVELIVEGKDTLVDRAILEQLQAPLMHLFRNAFDHGIEMPKERRAKGKQIPAKIVLSAEVKENKLVVAIADDGRGIDLQKVYRRAVEMGLIEEGLSAQGELNNSEILEFIFAPGFSTAAAVSDLSGRGVGLDIVRLQVGRLGGAVQVETILGKGTKFTISLPMRLGILPLLLCKCCQQTLAIPSVSVLEIIEIAEAHSSTLRTITWRDRELPLFPLLHLLPYPRLDTIVPVLNPSVAIILDVSGSPVAVTVDSLLGERELVIKSFDNTVNVPAFVAGCTVLGSGEVVPVLSPNQFGELIERYKNTRAQTGNNLASLENKGSILVVDDSLAVRRALEMLLTQAGYQVIKCRDGKEALAELQHERIDLVISDLDMPRLDGLSLLKEIRANSSTSHLPVIILTARENKTSEQLALNLGATAYLKKPIAPESLLATISVLLSAPRLNAQDSNG